MTNKTDVSSSMPIADHRNPWMGLDGKICKYPVYWCRLHRVWLSERDVERKKCFEKLDYNMISFHSCSCIERRDNPWIK